MSKYTIDDSTLESLAGALRLKCDASEVTFSPARMRAQVLKMPYTSVPSYLRSEAKAVAEKIRALRDTGSRLLVFAAVSDIHAYANSEHYAASLTSARHAAMALETAGAMVDCDFFVNLGDNCWETNIDTENGYAGAAYTMDTLRSAFAQVPSYSVPGNHDRSSDTQKLFDLVCAGNDFDAWGTTQIRGFGYKDLAEKKVRLIFLNTIDYLYAAGGHGMSYDQKDFLLRALDLSGKSDAADWQILLLSHFPIDFAGGDYNIHDDLQTIFNAYVNGSAAEITVDSAYALNEDPTVYQTYSGGSLVYDYSGKNAARIIANIHGHVHTNACGRMEGHALLRMSTPNSCFFLNKTDSYPENGDYSISEEEAVKLQKAADCAQDTSATFYCIDLDQHIIHAFGFGANTDRSASYGDAKNYAVVYALTNVTSSNTASSAPEGSVFETVLTAADGTEFSSVTVSMGGEDITAQVCPEGVIRIEAVTGNIVITASAAAAVSYTNLFDASDDDFEDGVRFSSSGGTTSGSGFISGYIAAAAGDVIRVRCPGADYAADYYGSIYRCVCEYDEDKAFLSTRYPSDSSYGVILDSDGQGFTYTVLEASASYIRVAGHRDGNYTNFVVTKNEEIL